MTNPLPNIADLMNENRLLQKAIAEAKQQLDTRVASLRAVLDEEIFVHETPIEVSNAMELACETITTPSQILQQSIGKKRGNTTPTPDGPTRQQGQFLAFIREFMLRNPRGVAPTHTELQGFFRLTPPSVNSMLKRLDERGYIRRIPGQARAIELTIDPELIPTLDRPFT